MYLQVFLKTTKYKTNKWITTCTDLINFYLSTYLFWLSSLKRKQKCQFQVYRIIGCRKIEVWCQTGQNGQHDYIFHLRELEIGGLFLFLFPIFSYQVSLLMTFSGSFNNSLPNILRLGGGEAQWATRWLTLTAFTHSTLYCCHFRISAMCLVAM